MKDENLILKINYIIRRRESMHKILMINEEKVALGMKTIIW